MSTRLPMAVSSLTLFDRRITVPFVEHLYATAKVVDEMRHQVHACAATASLQLWASTMRCVAVAPAVPDRSHATVPALASALLPQ